MKVAFRSDVGKLMQINEDIAGWVTLRTSGMSEMLNTPGTSEMSVISKISQQPGIDRIDILFVSDGMGGHKKGDVASRIATQYLTYLVQNAISRSEGDIVQELVVKLPGYMKNINTHLRSQASGNPDLSGMGCTLTAAIMIGNSMVIVHAGDSRLYHIADGRLRQVTKDHSFVQELLDKGEIQPDEAFDHPKKNKIHTALGPKDDINADAFVEVWESGTLLFCTDGLNDMLRDHEILDIVNANPDPEDMCEKLVEAALEKGGHDNVSVLVASK